jgi:Putative peptidoglycan binding domain
MATRAQFVEAVFRKLNVPWTGPNRNIGVAWAAAEGSNALNNPLDTTEEWPLATEFNDVGVKNYPTWQDGIDATVETFNNGDYDGLLAALRSESATVVDKLNAINASPWGTTISETLYGDVQSKFASYNTEVAGSPPDSDVAPTRDKAPSEKEEEAIGRNEHKFADLPVLKEGDSSKSVLIATVLLKFFGFLVAEGEDAPSDKAEPSSEFTPAVTKSVTLMQQMYNLKTDGVIGSEMWTAFFI